MWGGIVRTPRRRGVTPGGGMPSTRQLVGGKEGLNKANDSTAITAERSILNIGIPVWNQWRGADGGGEGRGQPQPGQVVYSCQTDNRSSSSNNHLCV